MQNLCIGTVADTGTDSVTCANAHPDCLFILSATEFLHYKVDLSFEKVSSSTSADVEGIFSWIIQTNNEAEGNTL